MGNFFTDLFSTKPAEDAAKAKIAGINQGITTANTALDTGKGEADALYGKALEPFTSLTGKFGAGQDLYNDATGVNGAEGITRAGSVFKTLPGYSGGLTTGVDQLLRNANVRGDLAGGNTSTDLIKFASDYDANKYGSFLQALAPNLSGATTAATGQAGVLSGNAAADLGVAGQKAGIGYQGNAAIGDANAEAEKAKYGASQNFWNALLGGVKLAAAIPTGGLSLAVPSFGPTSLGGAAGPSPLH